MACCVYWLSHHKVKKNKKENVDRIQPCCTPERMVKKSVTPVSVLIQQLESAHSDLNIFLYFCGTPYMDNMFCSDGLLMLSNAFLKSV